MPERAFLLLVALALIVTACGSDEGAADGATSGVELCSTTVETAGAGMTVQDGDAVEIHYQGTLDDGEQFDSSYDRGTPLSFTVASGQVITGFDDAVRGLAVGDTRTCSIPPEEAYGQPSDEFILELPYGESQSDVQVGDEVYLTNGQSAVILEVKEDTVVLDANHPLAGKTLTFLVEVISITRP